jgi:peptide subunit release factor 1 (eRF1)
MKKQIGIWMDKREAKIVSIEEKDERLLTILSEVEDFRPKGGSGSKMKGGPQDVVQDKKFLERKKHQLKAYFDEVIAALSEVESVVVLGPADTGKKFVKELADHHSHLSEKVSGVEKADNMTDNQLKAWVRAYFA